MKNKNSSCMLDIVHGTQRAITPENTFILRYEYVHMILIAHAEFQNIQS